MQKGTAPFSIGDKVTHSRQGAAVLVVADVYYREHVPGDGAASTWCVSVPGLCDAAHEFTAYRREHAL